MNIGFYPFIHAWHGQRWLSSVSVGRRGYCEAVRQQDRRPPASEPSVASENLTDASLQRLSVSALPSHGNEQFADDSAD